MADQQQAENKRPASHGMGYFTYRAIDTVMEGVASVVSFVLKIFGSAVIVLLLAGMLFACIFAYYVKNCLVSELDVSLSDYRINQSSTIWYDDGSGEYKELVTLMGKENRDWVEYEQIPKYMEQAVVAIEDKRFYDHKGVDWYRTSGALIDMFFTMRKTYGGSTELEKRYDKQEIMEWYLNVAYFGEGCWGVQTAAKKYFGKDVSELSLAECAAIAGITNLPTYYDPFYSEENNKNRQETILREMYNQGYITYAEFKQACAEPLYFARTPEEDYVQQIYTYYEEVVIQDVIDDLAKRRGISQSAARTLVFNGGYQIYCCLDPDIQAAVDNIYEDLNAIPQAAGTQQLQSSIVVMDPYDGRIVALSGGVGEKKQNFPLNRATGTKRSPGSAFKPIASYGPATELMTIFEALQYSLNTVAAQIVDKLTPETCYNYLIQKLGVTSLVPDDCSYAPMALGQLTNGITVREMAAAYCSFVNDGVFTYSRTYSRVTDKQGNIVLDNPANTVQAFSANTAHVMTYMLENAVENGTGTEANLGSMPVAGKTGTSGEYKDRWFVGCTPYYVAAVWTGFDTPARINISGNPAARLWKAVMRPIHEGLSYRSFPYPYLGPNTGVFGITDADLASPTNPNMNSVFTNPGSAQFPGMFITGDYQPEIYVAPDTQSTGGGFFTDNGSFPGGFAPGGNNIVIFG